MISYDLIPIDLPVSIKSCGTSSRQRTVEGKTYTNVAKKRNEIFIVSSIPNHKISSGENAVTGIYLIADTIGDIIKTKRGKLWLIGKGLMLKKKMDKNNKANKKGNKKSGGFEVDLKGGAPSGLMDMMGGFTLLRLTSMMGMMNLSFTKEELLKYNKQLNRIKKPKTVK